MLYCASVQVVIGFFCCVDGIRVLLRERADVKAIVGLLWHIHRCTDQWCPQIQRDHLLHHNARPPPFSRTFAASGQRNFSKFSRTWLSNDSFVCFAAFQTKLNQESAAHYKIHITRGKSQLIGLSLFDAEATDKNTTCANWRSRARVTSKCA